MEVTSLHTLTKARPSGGESNCFLENSQMSLRLPLTPHLQVQKILETRIATVPKKEPSSQQLNMILWSSLHPHPMWLKCPFPLNRYIMK